MLKKYKVIFTLLSVILFLFGFHEEVYGLTNEESSIEKKVLNDDLSINLLSDDRVAPVVNYDTLEEYQLDLILKEIGYPIDSIFNWDIERKQQLASYGGKYIETELEEYTHEYISTNGEKHIVTPENEKEIREVQKEDIETLGLKNVSNYNLAGEAEPLFTTSDTEDIGIIGEDNFAASLMILYLGESGQDLRYLMAMEYSWSPAPVSQFGDNAGLHWGSYGQPVAGTASGLHAREYASDGSWLVENHEIDQSSGGGVTSQFGDNRSALFTEVTGFLEEEVWINKNDIGRNLTLSGAYSHPWFPNNWNMSISGDGLSFDSTLDQAGDQWSWRLNFIPEIY